MTKSVLLLSGGMDSATLLGELVVNGDNILCININYGQRHSKEIQCAEKLARYYDVPIEFVNIGDIQRLLKGSALTDIENIEVPEGHYEEESMKLTVVPNRNMIMLSIAGAYAVAMKADKLYYAAHAGDHAIYPDCREEFIEAAANALKIGNYHDVELVPLYISHTKSEILEIGLKLEVPYEHTWTCYKGKEKACGKCGSCTERLEAFEKNGVKDPLEYE